MISAASMAMDIARFFGSWNCFQSRSSRNRRIFSITSSMLLPSMPACAASNVTDRLHQDHQFGGLALLDVDDCVLRELAAELFGVGARDAHDEQARLGAPLALRVAALA